MIDLNPAIPERISAGENYDIGLTNPHYAMTLTAAGHADGERHRPFGRVPLAVAQKAGSAVIGRTDGKNIVSLFQAAESIACTGAGTSGRTYVEIIEKMGIADAVVPKSGAMGGGEPVVAVANGELS